MLDEIKEVFEVEALILLEIPKRALGQRKQHSMSKWRKNRERLFLIKNVASVAKVNEK